MRKIMWKKGFSVAMAAAVMASPISVPTVFQNTAIVKAAETSETKSMPENPTVIEGYVYATVNMEYADFFYGELMGVGESSEITPDLSADKVASYREKGMYDAVTSATSTKSTKYATSWYETGVTNDEAETKDKNGNVTNTNLYGVKNVQIKIPKALYDNLYSGKDGAYKDSKVIEYLNKADYSDQAFSTEYKVLNADGTFSKMFAADGTVENKDANPVLTTSTIWGDYEIDIDNLSVGDVEATTANLYGIILTDKDGNNYGLLHSDNTWLQTQKFSWAVDDVFSVHGQNNVPNGRTDGLKAGNTITKITYLLKDSPDIVINTNTKLKTLLGDNVSGTAEKALWNSAGTKVKFTLNNAPADDYDVATVVKGARHGTTIDSDKWSYDKETKTLTMDASCIVGTDYIATLKSENYGDIKITFAIDKKSQTVATAKDTYTVSYGAKAFNLGAKADTALTYTSSNSNVAAVDAKGNVTIKNAGTAVITVKASADDNHNEAVKTIKITVNKAGAAVSAKSSVTKVYGSKAFSLGARATTGTVLKYQTSNSKVATISSKGTVSIKGTGIVTITVTASSANHNTAVKKVTLKVVPKKQSIKAKAGKRKLTLQWKKDKKTSGYQIKIGTKKSFKGAKTYTVKSYKTYKKTIKKLKAKKKYYVKVRSYKVVGKSKLYGSYSSVKCYKIK